MCNNKGERGEREGHKGHHLKQMTGVCSCVSSTSCYHLRYHAAHVLTISIPSVHCHSKRARERDCHVKGKGSLLKEDWVASSSTVDATDQ